MEVSRMSEPRCTRSRPHRGSLGLLPVLLCLPLPGGAAAQAPQGPDAEYLYEAETRARWLHGRQQGRFTPFQAETHWIQVDSVEVEEATGERTMHLLLGGDGGDMARVRFDAGGGVLAVEVRLRSPPDPGFVRPGMKAQFARRRLFTAGHVAFPELRVRALVPRFPVTRPAAGVRWTDTLDVVLDRDGFRQEVHGPRVSTIVRDTLVDGRMMWIVADSARVGYTVRSLRDERTLDTVVVLTRRAEGTITGRHVYDPMRGLYRVRHDTTALAGTAELRYPDGRTFRTPARFQRTRRIQRYTPAEHLARRAELRAQHEARFGGMVMLPVDEVEERLAARDTALRDSLIGAWQTTQDPDERGRLGWLLLSRGDWEHDLEERMDQLALEAGDTAWVLSRLARRLYGSEPFDADVVRAALPFLRDPGLAFAFGIDTDPLYENPRQALLLAPPAVLEDSTQWPCTPSGCRLLAAQTDALEPRLRALALIAQFVLDPAAHASAIEAAAARGNRFVEPALAMMHGYLLNWPMSDARHPLPGPTDDWRAWIRWMNPLPPWFPDSLDSAGPRVSFDGHAANTIHVYERVSGRDVTAEISARAAEAEADSARLVFGVMMLGLRPDIPDPAEVVAHLRSGSEALRALGQHQLDRVFRNAEPWASDSTATLLDRLLGVLIEGAEPWPVLDPDARGFRLGAIGSGGHRPDEGPVFLQTDSLPAAVAAAWRGRATLVSAAEWRRRSTRLPGILFRTRPVLRIGPFVRLRVDYQSRYRRAQDQAPEAYAGGVDVTLMRTDDGWVIVGVGGWVT